jgi:hypothetical protein
MPPRSSPELQRIKRVSERRMPAISLKDNYEVIEYFISDIYFFGLVRLVFHGDSS